MPFTQNRKDKSRLKPKSSHKGLLDDIDTVNKYNRDTNKVSWRWPLVILLLASMLYYGVYYIEQSLPKPVTLNDLKRNPGLFSAEHSKRISNRLTNLGPRIVGDVLNEVIAPKIIEEEVEEIKRNKSPYQSILLQRQKGSGAYNLQFKPVFTNVYDNIQNVIVMLEGSEGSHSILLNCHYDTVPTSSGASDDVISCSAMLEVLRALSISPIRLKHNVVFLFNGAEEVPLQAAHLFLQHEWASKCRIVLNLEAAGVGGPNYLFQSGPNHSWLSEYYAKSVPHPRGQIVGEELFQNGAIPSDTDFRIFRDFGNMAGMDFAFWQNGYLYHTKYDAKEYITFGSHQQIGDNTLALVQALGNAVELNDMKANSQGQNIYYDYIGFFMIIYSKSTNLILNLIAFSLSIVSVIFSIGYPFRKMIAREFVYKVFGRLLALICAIGASAGIGFSIDYFAALAMPWYGHPLLIFPLFACPSIVIYFIISYYMDKWRSTKLKMSISKSTQCNIVASQAPWMLIMICLTVTGFRSSSLFFPMVITSAISSILIHFISLNGNSWMWIYMSLHIPVLAFNIYCVNMFFMLIIPILGRSGPINADLILGGLSSLFTMFLISFLMPLLAYVRKPGRFAIILTLIFTVTYGLVVSGIYGESYTVDASLPKPQRYMILHTNREFRDEFEAVRRNESGYLVFNLDRNSPRTIPKSENLMTSLSDDCSNEMYCGIPLITSRILAISPKSTWIPATAPNQLVKTELVLENDRNDCNAQTRVCRLSFTLKGPDRLAITFTPREGASLVEWSIPTDIINSGEWQGRPSYFIHIVRGNIEQDLKLNLTFKVSEEQLHKPIVDIGISSHHFHHDAHKTSDFKAFLDKFPKWTHITSWFTAYKFYVLPSMVLGKN